MAPPPAQQVDTVSEDDDSDDATTAALPDAMESSQEHRRKINKKGLELLSNGVVSMRTLPLAKTVPTKTRDPEAPKLFHASPSLSKAFTLFCFIHSGKHMPVEKIRDEHTRLLLLHSAAKFSLTEESLNTIMEADIEERHAYLIGLAKITQQVIRYSLYGHTINYICDKVLTQHDVHPPEDVKIHLGLTGEHSKKSFMDV